MVTGVDDVTERVVTVKVALVAPAVTVTLAGTVATFALPLASVTEAPPDGAGALRVTVPCAEPPPVTAVGLSASEESVTGCGGGGAAAGCTLSSAGLATPLQEAAMVTEDEAVAGPVAPLQAARARPAG